YFDNLADSTDSDKYGEIATNLLITDLSESDYLSVLSNQRVYDVLKKLGSDENKKVDKETALKIADEADAKWIIFGNILQVEPEFIITSQLISAESGKVAASQKINGEQDESIFSVIDKLTIEIKSDLALPDDAFIEPDKDVAEVTTSSPEAYQAYLQGLKYYGKFYEKEAYQYFNEAIRLDSNFAMAHFYLSMNLSNTVAIKHLQKALDLSSNVSKHEHYYITSRAEYILSKNVDQAIKVLEEATHKYPDDKFLYYQIGVYSNSRQKQDYAGAISSLKKAIELDPYYKAAYNHLAYTYQNNREYENAILTIDKYIVMVPDEANPYDTRGDIYYRAGNINKAMESYEKAISIKPDFEASIHSLAEFKLIQKDFEIAEALFTDLLDSQIHKYRRRGEFGLLLANIYKGKISGTMPILDSLIAYKNSLDSSDYNMQILADCYLLKSKIYNELGQFDLALDEFNKFYSTYLLVFPNADFPFIHYKVRLLAKNDNIDEAWKIINELREAKGENRAIIFKFLSSRGMLEYTKGNLDSAEYYMNKALDTSFSYYPQYTLGRIYFEQGNIEQSLRYFSFMVPINYRIDPTSIIWNIKTHYYLGRLYEKSHLYSQAIFHYSAYLDYWSEADIKFAEIEDAQNRYDRLNKETNGIVP
ncbi:MAG: tetratricopeptide repeat protein, partial [candidate division Zixibacteria bacterium]|nr:tetratricopeptide repeat protein [candidate division Zixibacteria bacterium]